MKFQRDGFTWLAYLLLALYSYLLNAFGPITPYLKSELNLSYKVSSLHFTAFAAGILLAGIFGDAITRRIGRAPALWAGAFGISLWTFALALGKSPLVTISASLLMGTIGSLILAIVPAALADRHGEFTAVAISEANVIASLVASAAPLLVGWSAALLGNWRPAIVGVALSTLLLYPIFYRFTAPSAGQSNPRNPGGRLPLRYWIYWTALALAVSIEFCMISWSADYLETVIRLPRAGAAQSVSLFLVAMIAGRLAASRLAPRFSIRRLILASVLLAACGFLVFWLASTSLMALSGLFLTGLGVAGLYPLILTCAIESAGDSVLASARATLASGSAILALPLVLGSLADATGIHSAYSVVLVLLAGVFLIIYLVGRSAINSALPRR